MVGATPEARSGRGMLGRTSTTGQGSAPWAWHHLQIELACVPIVTLLASLVACYEGCAVRPADASSGSPCGCRSASMLIGFAVAQEFCSGVIAATTAVACGALLTGIAVTAIRKRTSGSRA